MEIMVFDDGKPFIWEEYQGKQRCIIAHKWIERQLANQEINLAFTVVYEEKQKGNEHYKALQVKVDEILKEIDGGDDEGLN